MIPRCELREYEIISSCGIRGPELGASTPWTTKGVRPQEQQTLWAQSFPHLAWHWGLWILEVRRAAWVLLFLVAAVVFIYLLIYFASQTQPYWQASACPWALFHPLTAVHTEIISCRGVGNRCRTDIFPFLLSSLAVFLPPYKLLTACCLPLAVCLPAELSSPVMSRASALELTSS